MPPFLNNGGYNHSQGKRYIILIKTLWSKK